MADSEKIVWLKVALAEAVVLLFLHSLVAVIPGPSAEMGRAAFVAATVIVGVPYLLILSWRAAYIAGRKNR
jgi:hypothetical protein